MIDLIGMFIVVGLLCTGIPLGIAAAIIWLAVGVYSTVNSPSRGMLADVGFVFGAPIYWILEG